MPPTAATLTEDQGKKVQELKKLFDTRSRTPGDKSRITELVKDLMAQEFSAPVIGQLVDRAGGTILQWSKKNNNGPRAPRPGTGPGNGRPVDPDAADKEVDIHSLRQIKDRVVAEFTSDMLAADHFRTKYKAIEQIQGENFYNFIDKAISLQLMLGDGLEDTIDTLTLLVDESRAKLDKLIKDNKRLRQALNQAHAELRVYEKIYNRAFRRD